MPVLTLNGHARVVSFAELIKTLQALITMRMTHCQQIVCEPMNVIVEMEDGPDE